MTTESMSFAENFSVCCTRSCEQLVCERAGDEEQVRAGDECDELFKKIAAKLGNDHDLIDDFDAAKNHVQSLDNQSIYQQGFRDCVFLLRWIGML